MTLLYKWIGKSPSDRSRKTWEEGVTEDAAWELGTSNWKRSAANRDGWRRKLKEAKERFWAVALCTNRDVYKRQVLRLRRFSSVKTVRLYD